MSVIMPAYNEAGRIFGNVLETAETLKDIADEIIVVDDGSLDGTYDEALRAVDTLNSANVAKNQRLGLRSDLNSESDVKVLRYEVNRGKGHALRFGFSHSAGDLVAFLDADLDLHPSQIRILLDVMRDTAADVVIGSKMHPDSRLNYPWVRKVISSCYYGLVRLLFSLPIHDSQTGIKLFRREVLELVMPRMRVQRFAHDLELLVGAHRFGYRIVEAPVLIEFHRNQPRPRALIRASVNVWLDTLRVFYWASFWTWLNPGTAIRLWIIALLLGVSSLSFGIASFLVRAGLPDTLRQVARILLLQFISQPVRDAMLILGGILIVCVSCLQLNKHILSAFMRSDQGDLAGIVNARKAGPAGKVQDFGVDMKSPRTDDAGERP